MVRENCFNIYSAGIYKVRDNYNSGNKEKYYSNSQFNLPSYHMQQEFKTLLILLYNRMFCQFEIYKFQSQKRLLKTW